MENYRKFVGLRYALIPYIYTCSRVAHETGLPLVRGMYLEYPDQEPAYTFQQQYLFGKDLLVAPITAPGDGKAVRREVFLPAGQDWFDYFTGEFYAGGQTIAHECPLDRMPLFVRAGSILPMAPAMDYSDQKPVDPLDARCLCRARARREFALYEDDGTSLDYRAGAHVTTLLRFNPEAAGNYTLRIGAAQGKFNGQLAKRRYRVQVHGLCKPDRVALNGRNLPEIEPGKEGDGWWWNQRERTITVRLDKPLSTSKEAVLSLSNAGTYADLSTWQKAWNLRAQLRQVKRDMKLKHAALVGGPGIKKPPRVIRDDRASRATADRHRGQSQRLRPGPAGLTPRWSSGCGRP